MEVLGGRGGWGHFYTFNWDAKLANNVMDEI